MQHIKHLPLKTLGLALAAVLATGAAQAHQSGDIIVRLGATGTHINKDLFQSTANDLEAGNFWDFDGLSAKMRDDTAPALDVTWMFSDAFGLNVSGSAYAHDLRARYSGTDPDLQEADGLNLLEVKQRPISIGAVWYPLGNTSGKLHPYVGLSATHTRAKLRIHGDLVQREHAIIDEDLADGWITEAEAAADHQLLDTEVAAARVSESKWGSKANIGVDYSITDQWLINTQVGYTRAASNLGYWNYTVGVGFKF